MNNTLVNMLFSKLMKKWGPSKLSKVLGLIAIGAGTFGYAGATFIPDDPDEDDKAVEEAAEKSSKKKSTKRENN